MEDLADPVEVHDDETLETGNEQPTEAEPTQEDQDSDQNETNEDQAEEVWPKKAENAVRRRDKQIGKLYSEKQEMQQTIQQLQQQLQTHNTQGQELREEDFNTFGEYLVAVAQQAGGGQAQPGQGRQPSQQELLAHAKTQIQVEQRIHEATAQIDKAREEIPGFQQLETEYGDVLGALPQPVLHALLDAKNPELAFFALAKEGTLENIATLPSHQAAMEIARAEIRGEQLVKALKAPKVPSAPAPIKGVNSGGAGGLKDLEDMSTDELMKWVNS